MIEGGKEPRPITATPTEYVIDNCNGCNAVNYSSPNGDREKVSVIFALRAGSMVSNLCPACMVRVRAAIDEAMYQYEASTADPQATEEEVAELGEVS